VSLVSIRELSRNPSAVVDEVERSGRPALVTRNGKPIAALVRIEQDKLEDWLLSTVADPPIGVSRSVAGCGAADRVREPPDRGPHQS
jgi:prevent-host-death family protein